MYFTFGSVCISKSENQCKKKIKRKSVYNFVLCLCIMSQASSCWAEEILFHSYCACMLCYFSRVQFCVSIWTVACQVLCPWDCSSKSTGVGCHILLQGIFATHGWNMHLLHVPCWQADLLPLAQPGNSHHFHL